jgi:hypothetical protein
LVCCGAIIAAGAAGGEIGETKEAGALAAVLDPTANAGPQKTAADIAVQTINFMNPPGNSPAAG